MPTCLPLIIQKPYTKNTAKLHSRVGDKGGPYVDLTAETQDGGDGHALSGPGRKAHL